MKRVGIITLFHGSLNFGGVLQSCALCKALDQLNIPNEQIRCIYEGETEKRSFLQTLRKLMNPAVVLRRIRYELVGMHTEHQKSGRREAFAAFNSKYIPSSSRVYTKSDIRECLAHYSAFITGSDQVWNPEWYCPTLFLDFVPEDVTKVAYAASLGKSSLTEQQQNKFRNHLKDFSAVSVRELDAVDIVAPLSPVNVECTLDPTLLLTAEQWDAVCAPRLIEENYVFYYFLGQDSSESVLAKEFAKNKELKIAGIPNSARDFNKKETIVYDYSIWDASPAEFLSLIKYASVVVTDSFHATVFSNVFGKEHYVFPRAGHAGMTSRIHRIADLFGTMDRFCDIPEKKTLEYMLTATPIDYMQPHPELEQMRMYSMEFLRKNLGE